MSKNGILSWFISLVVVHRKDRYLLVQENRPGKPWFLPAGRVDRNESLEDGAIRETLEEAGIKVNLTGVLRIEHTAQMGIARIRVFFTAEPADDTAPKSHADRESICADWFTLDEIKKLNLRGKEVLNVLTAFQRGCPVYPLDLLKAEGAKWGISES